MWFTGYCARAGWVGLVLMVALWAGLLAVVFWGVRRMFPPTPRREEPLDRLSERLATGDIEPAKSRRQRDRLADADNR